MLVVLAACFHSPYMAKWSVYCTFKFVYVLLHYLWFGILRLSEKSQGDDPGKFTVGRFFFFNKWNIRFPSHQKNFCTVSNILAWLNPSWSHNLTFLLPSANIWLVRLPTISNACRSHPTQAFSNVSSFTSLSFFSYSVSYSKLIELPRTNIKIAWGNLKCSSEGWWSHVPFRLHVCAGSSHRATWHASCCVFEEVREVRRRKQGGGVRGLNKQSLFTGRSWRWSNSCRGSERVDDSLFLFLWRNSNHFVQHQ